MDEEKHSGIGCWAQVKGGFSKAAKQAAKKAASAAQLSLARASGRLKRLVSAFPGPLADVPQQSGSAGPLPPSSSPHLAAKLAARIKDTPTLTRRALAAALTARITSQRRVSALQAGRFIYRVWLRLKLKDRRGRSRLAMLEAFERKVTAASHPQRVKDYLEEEMAVLKEFREEVERRRIGWKRGDLGRRLLRQRGSLAEGQGAPLRRPQAEFEKRKAGWEKSALAGDGDKVIVRLWGPVPGGQGG